MSKVPSKSAEITPCTKGAELSFRKRQDGGRGDLPTGALPFDPLRFKAVYPDRWGQFIRANFRSVQEAALFFSVTERTARYWWEGSRAPQGHFPDLARAAFPASYSAIVLADVA